MPSGSMRVLVGALGFGFGFGLGLAAGESLAAPIAVLDKVVVLSRHGVRAPTQSDARLASWAAHPWPSWPVARGELTPRGAELIRWTWAAQRDGLSAILGAGCPAPAAVRVHADTDQRTRATASALLAALAPGCGLRYSVAATRHDPLFHPLKAGVCRFDPAAARAAVEAAGGGLTALAQRLRPSLAVIDAVSGMPISSWPTAVKASRVEVEIAGALGVGSSMAEIFALEWGQWPRHAPAWGALDGASLAALMPLHVAVFAQVNRTPYVAERRGSALLAAIATALAADDGQRLVAFVGHDTNIANVAALLDLQWTLPGRAPNEIPPGSALVFERWREESRTVVRVRFLAPSPLQMHADPPVGAPPSAALRLACGTRCDSNEFAAQARRSIRAECVPRQRPTSPGAP